MSVSDTRKEIIATYELLLEAHMIRIKKAEDILRQIEEKCDVYSIEWATPDGDPPLAVRDFANDIINIMEPRK